MKKKTISDAQVLAILKQAENGVPVSELCREHGMSSAAFYQWRTKYGGMDASMLSEMRDMRAEMKRLKRMYACLLYTSPSPRDGLLSRMPSSA